MNWRGFLAVWAIVLIGVAGCGGPDSTPPSDRLSTGPPAPPIFTTPPKQPVKDEPVAPPPQKPPKKKTEAKPKTPEKPAAAKNTNQKSSKKSPQKTARDPNALPPGKRYATADETFGSGNNPTRISAYYARPIWARFLNSGQLLVAADVLTGPKKATGPFWFAIDPLTGVIKHRVSTQIAKTESAAVTPDGSVAVALASGKVYAIDLSNQGAVEEIQLGASKGPRGSATSAETIKCVALAPDGQSIVIGSTRRIALWNRRRQRIVREVAAGPITCIDVSNDGATACAAGEKTVALWDLNTGQQQVLPNRNLFGTTSLAFVPNGLRVVVATESLGTVRLLASCPMRTVDTVSGRVTASFMADQPVSCVAVFGDERQIVSGDAQGNVVVWNAKTGKRVRTVHKHTKRVRCVSAAPDNRCVASLGDDMVLAVTPLTTKSAKPLIINGRQLQQRLR